MLLHRGEVPKGERLLDFPSPPPLFVTRAFASRNLFAGVPAIDLVFLEQRGG